MPPGRKLYAWVFSLSLLLPLFAPPGLARAESGPQGFIADKQSQVTMLLRQPYSPERERRISQVLDSMLDYDALAQDAMGSHWGELTAAQKKEFTGLLKQLVQRSYERNIKGILDWNVQYLGEEPTPPGVTVHSRATSKRNVRSEPVTIDYQVVTEPPGYRVRDIVTEGSSLVNNYRNQFGKIMRQDGYEALITRMKNKIRQGGEAHAQ